MSQSAGQAARRGALQGAGGCGRLLHAIMQFCLAVLIVASIGAGLLAVRLAQGPLDVDWIARRITENASTSRFAVSIGGAALTWEGLHNGSSSPVDLVLRDVRVKHLAPGTTAQDVVLVPRAAVSFSVAGLLRGQLAFRSITLDGVRLTLQRAADGTMFDISPDTGAPAAPASDLQALVLRGLTAPPRPTTDRTAALWSSLRFLHIRDSSVTMDDRKLALTWSAPGLNIDLVRSEAGGVTGTVATDLVSGPETLKLNARLALLANTNGIGIAASLSPANPAHLARLSPAFAKLAALDAPVTISGTADLDGSLGFTTASANISIGSGTVYAGTGSAPIRAATMTADITPDTLKLNVHELRLQVRDDSKPTHIAATIDATDVDHQISAKMTVDVDQVAFADLPTLWPPGTGGPGTRPWMVANITGGLIHDGHAEMTAVAPDDFSDGRLTSLSGGAEGSDVTVHWMRPVPPIEHGEAHVVLVDPDTLDVIVKSGRQSGTQITARSGKLRFTGLSGHNQFIAIQSDLAGPFSDVATLLRHPAIHLIDRLPMTINNPTGDVTAHLTANFPLKNELTLDQVVLHANGKLLHGHIGDIAAGHDIDNGMFDYDVGNAGLKISGPGDVAGIPSQIRIELDFLPGPSTGVNERVNLTATATSKELSGLGLDTQGRLTGPVGVRLDYFTRRDTSADLRLQADLANAGFDGGRLPWHKKPGSPATLDAHLLLKSGHLTSIERLKAEGSGLSVLLSADTQNGRPDHVKIQRLVLGNATDVSGEIDLPQGPVEPSIITLTGPSIDLSSEFNRKSPQATKDDEPGPAFSLEAQFGRVVLSDGRQINDLHAKIESDGVITKTARLSATAGAGPFSISIVPQQGGRKLTAEASDAGAMLYALDIIQSMKGGHLTVNGVYDDHDSSHTLRGTAEISDFRIANAPAVVRLLQALSVYGLLEVAQGPGLGVTKLEAPFRLGRQILSLDDAHAYSPSLGFTVKGQIDLNRRVVALDGTVVPAYFFNSLLGKLPLIGRLFSPEVGGGLFAANYSIHGSFDNPDVSVNPLSAMTPGFLRGFFNMFQADPSPAPSPAPQR